MQCLSDLRLTIRIQPVYDKSTNNSKFFLLIKLVLYNDTNMEMDMKVKIFQKGFNYSQDGQGNRLVFHLQGCNMRCPWCSNPEGMSPDGVLFVEKEWLKESCCPRGAVKKGVLDRSICKRCNEHLCIRNRRQKGIRLSCKEYEVDDIVRECVISKPMFFENGGITLTGGEIGIQFDAVKELLEKLGHECIHRAIESNGTHPGMEELIPYVDQWIMDVKHYNNDIHKEWVGVSNVWVIKNLEIVSARHSNVLIRIPLIPGFNDSKKDAEGFAHFFIDHIKGEATKVEILTYHEFGKGKWEQCGMEYKMPSVRIQPGTAEYFEKVLGSYGIRCVRT